MWYVTAMAEYPIYEPAEGGYYYAGTQIVWERQFQSRRKARQFFNRARRDFTEVFGEHTDPDKWWDTKNRVSGNYRDCIYHSTPYIGEGHELTLTRKPRRERGWVPYE